MTHTYKKQTNITPREFNFLWHIKDHCNKRSNISLTEAGKRNFFFCVCVYVCEYYKNVYKATEDYLYICFYDYV